MAEITNASLNWDVAEYPFYDLAYINLTTPLPDDVLSNTKFELHHLAPQLQLPKVSRTYWGEFIGIAL